MRALRTLGCASCLIAASAWGCGRTGLTPSDVEVSDAGSGGSRATAGRGGSAEGGKAAGGSASGGRATGGTASGGGATGRAGAGGRAGSGGAAPVVCHDPLELQSVEPTNGTVAFPFDGEPVVHYNCVVDPSLSLPESATLSGALTGPIPVVFTTFEEVSELWLTPNSRAGSTQPFFAGEQVTAWLGNELGGPYLWQFTVQVSAASPGRFSAGSQDLSALPRAADTAAGDMDGDGDVDLLIGRRDELRLLLNQGDGSFDEGQALPGMGAPVVTGDVDWDGDLDIAAGERILLNDGHAHFTVGPVASGCVAMGDVDGDGDRDCLANTGWDDKTRELFGHVLFNDGKAAFSAGPQTEFGFECELADFDRDGDLDAVCVPPVIEGAHVFSNDGHGVFTQSDYELGSAGARAVAIGDLDLDGDIDIVVTHWGGPQSYINQIWSNDGHGHFEQTNSLGGDSGDLELGDLDGDGDLDALVSHLGPQLHGPFKPARVFLNDGKGNFTDSGRRVGEPAFHWFELADFDGDRDLDAFVYHQMNTDNDSVVWFNQE